MQHSLKSGFEDNPIVYHLMTDRFFNGFNDDSACGHQPQQTSVIGAYQGGSYAGITAKIEQGWFDELGINALWITAPYEQIHGWVAGGNAEFKHESYHGYWVLDYTTINRRFGSESDFASLVKVAHRRGIRLVLDVVVGHAGYWDLATLSEYLSSAVKSGWQDAMPENVESFFDFASGNLGDWWGKDWVYANLPGYIGEGDGAPELLHGLPKFRIDNADSVQLPAFLSRKSDTRAVNLPDTSVAGYITTWLSEWVAMYGIDGFRCDSVPHVGNDVWAALRQKCSLALQAWDSENQNVGNVKRSFWMTGEVYGNGIERAQYHDIGFDSLINFGFQAQVAEIFENLEAGDVYGHSLAMFRLDSLYSTYANTLNGDTPHDVLSYISSHDTGLFDRTKLFDGAAALMLAPGGIQLLYGDETARPPGDAPKGDSAQSYRSVMNWNSIDAALLAHWQKLGRFRSRHVAIARGVHRKLCDEPYVFLRESAKTKDVVVVGILPRPATVYIDVGGIFEEGSFVNDAYSSQKMRVVEGKIHIDASRIMLLEKAERE